MLKRPNRDADHRIESAGKRSPSFRRGMLTSLLLAGLLTLSACVGTPGSTTDTTNSEEDTMKDTVLDSTVQEQTPPEGTEAQTEPVTEPTPELSDHDKLMLQVTYNEAEKALLSETAAKMKGLRITYYADKGMTKTVKHGVAEPADLTFAKGSGVSAVVLEGFITFDTEGTYTITFDGAADGDSVGLIKGEHHVEVGRRMKLRAEAGAQYGIKLKATWDGENEDMTLSLNCDGKGGYTTSVGRVLLEHEPIIITPIMDIPMRDTFICTGPDGYYYMTGTSGPDPDWWDNNYVIHVYRSPDLENWEDLGVVWDFRTDATWAKDATRQDRVPVWAPEIAYVNGNWYLTYSMGFNDGYCGGILISTSGKPEGPYTDTSTKKLVDNIDASLFTDDDGTTYLIYKDGLIAPLNEDLSAFTAPFKPIYAADGLPVGFEGCSIFKHNGKYYLTAATYNLAYDQYGNLLTTYDSMIAISDNLYGPYSETRLLLRNGGHNNLFVDKDGNVWTTLFAPTGRHGFYCKPAIVKLNEDERGILSVPAPDGEN